jgi:hypothetical protein
MSNGAAAAGGSAAAVQAAIAEAIKASGAIVSVEPRDFETVLGKTETPLVVHARGGVFTTKYYYLTAYKGLIFYTRTEAPLLLPPKTELTNARKIWVPG